MGSALSRRRARRNVRHGLFQVLSLALLVAILLLVSAASASAAKTRVLINTFGAEGTTVANPNPLSNPQGIAVAQSDEDLYATDPGNHRIEKFDPLGNFLVAFGANVGGPGVDTCESVCEPGTKGSGPGEFTEPAFVAVDNSSGASTGDVYVADIATDLVSKFDSTGKLITTWGVGGQLSGSPEAAFGGVAGIAVDAAGNLHVLTTEGRIFEFAQDGTFVAEVNVSRQTLPRGLAVDAATDFFKVNGDLSIEKLDAGGSDVGQVTYNEAKPPATRTLTIDPATGDLYRVTEPDEATGRSFIEHYSFNGAGEVVESDGSTCANFEHEVSATAGCAPTDSVGVPFAASGIAVASTTTHTYLADPSEGAIYEYGPPVIVPTPVTGRSSDVQPTAAVLNGTVNPEGLPVTACSFEYGTEEGVYGQTAPCAQSPAEIGTGDAPVPVSAAITGLSEAQTYHFRLSVSNANGPAFGLDQAFNTTSPPQVSAVGVENLTSTTVDFVAQVNPGDGATTYHFEYGPTISYGTSVPVPDEGIAEGESNVAVRQHAVGLTPGTTYHFRLVTMNAAGTVASSDHTFIYGPEAEALPDGRAYEMVTPPEKNAGLIGDVLLGIGDTISEDGERLIMSSIQPFGGTQAGNADRQFEGEPYAFDRTSQGWAGKPLAPSAAQYAANSPFSANAELESVLYSVPTPPNGEDDFYAQFDGGALHDIGPATPPSLGPLGLSSFTGGPPTRATADLSHVVYPKSVESGPWPFDESTNRSLYQYSGTGNTAPHIVGVRGGAGSTDVISLCGTALGRASAVAAASYGSLSADGSIIYFTAAACEASSGHPEVPADELYARVNDAETIPISARSSGECTELECLESPPSAANFEGASADGSRVFFTSTQKLTDAASEDSLGSDTAATALGGCSATTNANGCNLYEYDFASPVGHRLHAVSAGDSSGEGPRVQGSTAIALDGSHVYFVAKGVLTSAPNSAGKVAVNGENNLYMYEAPTGGGGAHTMFVGTLAEEDSEEWAGARDGIGVANVSPNGNVLVFTSSAPLTNDDTRQGGGQQVFRYDAASGELVRISIGSNGFNDNGNAGTGDAAIVPAELGFYRAGPARPNLTMSEDGSYVFFQSPIGLTPRALNDVRLDAEGDLAENIYEYHEGHVSLISDGRDLSTARIANAQAKSAVSLIGVDQSGKNVFFTTADQLVSQDTDTQLDVYDARICEAADPCFVSNVKAQPPCQEEACRGTAPAAPPALAPGSEALGGSGNVAAVAPPVSKPKTAAQVKAEKLVKAMKACKKYRVKKRRTKCEAEARKRYGVTPKHRPAKPKHKAKKANYGAKS